MPGLRWLALLVLALQITEAAPARADSIIELKDGRRFVLPFGPDEIARSWFTPETSGHGAVRLVPPGAPLPGIAAGPSLEVEPAAVLRVGPGGDFARPSEAAAVAPDGALVEIAAGIYRDLAFWPQSHLVIRGVGGRPVIDGGGGGIGGKAVWVVAGQHVIIENIEITGGAVPDRNGAAIRAEGGDLTLQRMRIHGNEMGILTSRDFRGTLLIEDSEFFGNFITDYEQAGVPPGHNIYVSGAERFILRGSWIHSPYAGHNVKSRAALNEILYNRIEDGEGAGSYAIDIADAAPTWIIGNVIRQGPRAANRTLISFGAESSVRPETPLLVAFNTFENALAVGTFLRIRGPAAARVRNNLFLGGGELVDGKGHLHGNLRFPDVAAAGLDMPSFAPRHGSPAIDAAQIEPGEIVPDRMPALPLGTVARPLAGRAFDVGALEAAQP